MAGERTDDDRAAVAETVHAIFGDPAASAEELFSGPLLDWSRLRGETPWTARYDHRRTLERLEIVELSETHAVVACEGRRWRVRTWFP